MKSLKAPEMGLWVFYPKTYLSQTPYDVWDFCICDYCFFFLDIVKLKINARNATATHIQNASAAVS